MVSIFIDFRVKEEQARQAYVKLQESLQLRKLKLKNERSEIDDEKKAPVILLQNSESEIKVTPSSQSKNSVKDKNHSKKKKK